MTRKSTPYARQQARQTPWQRQRHRDVNHVKAAIIKNIIVADIAALRTKSELQAFMGANAARLVDSAGRLVFVTAHAARHHRLQDTPEARILAGTANALGDLAESPAQLETQRAAIISGLSAIERLMPHLDPFSLAQGALELDALMSKQQALGTGDVHRVPEVAA